MIGDEAVKLDDTFTYGQYRSWPDGKRWELIEGVAWAMSAPTTRHQKTIGSLHLLFASYLKGKPCEVFIAPYDVLLYEADEPPEQVRNVVQPDLMVFCDKTKIKEKFAWGAPDLAVEILSPSTTKKDLNDKFRLFEKHGVREYWVVDPNAKTIMIFRRSDAGVFDDGTLWEHDLGIDSIASKVVEGFSLRPAEVFEDLD